MLPNMEVRLSATSLFQYANAFGVSQKEIKRPRCFFLFSAVCFSFSVVLFLVAVKKKENDALKHREAPGSVWPVRPGSFRLRGTLVEHSATIEQCY